MIYIGGYGPLLCAVMFAAYIKQLRRADTSWEKDRETGKMTISA